MPNLTIYLNNELYDFVKRKPSKIIQEALTEKIEKIFIEKKSKL